MSYLGIAATGVIDPTRSVYKQYDAERFSGDGSTVGFVLSNAVRSALDIEVFVENVRQEPIIAYTVDGTTTITFTEAPPVGTENIYVIYRGRDLGYTVDVPDGSVSYQKMAMNIRQFNVDQFTANGTGQTFVLTETPASANTLDISVEGVMQSSPDNYTLSGNTVIFTSAPESGSKVIVKHLGFRTTTTVTALQADTITAIELADQAVVQAKLADGAVSEIKIATDAVTATKIANNSVTEPKISANAVTTSKIAANSVTVSKLSNDGGSANQVLRVNSTGTAVEFGTIQTANSGNYALRTYTSPGTWTKPTDLKAIKVTVIGGGASGGIGTASAGGGGAGGASILFLDAPSIPGPVAVTIGAGGASVPATSVAPYSPSYVNYAPGGGTSSFGAFASATGGSGGQHMFAGNGYAAAGGLGGSGSSGNLNIGGSPGNFGVGDYNNCVAVSYTGGNGGNSILGGGGRGYVYGTPITVAGSGGNAYGAGGGGRAGATPAGGPAVSYAGADGVVIVEEFF